MKAILDIARMELQKMFYSPIAWLVLIIFSIQSGIEIMNLASGFVRVSELGYLREAITFSMYSGMNGYFSSIQQWLFIFIPLITMGLMSKEFGSGSIKLLYSSPVSNGQIVLGKYLSVVVFSACMAIILLIAGLFGFVAIKDVDFNQILTGVLGLFLVMSTYAAVGLFISALTSYQIVAAIGTIFTLFVLQQVGGLWQSVDFVRDITYWLSIGGRAGTFVRGLICSEDVLYFILVPALFISFTIFRLKGIREKSPRYISAGRYISAFLMVAIIGYVSTIPSLMKYHDATRTKLNTLTKNSQDVISKLEGKIKITTYANIFAPNIWTNLPQSQVGDARSWSQYTRFYPNIKLDYKYYYDVPLYESDNKSFNRRYADKKIEEALEEVCNIYEINPDKIKPAEFYKDEINLKAELNRCVRKIETEDGKIAFLHWYDDMMRIPSESQKTAAFKSLIGNLPMVGFVEGHEERSVNNVSERGFYKVAKEKQFRYALRNNGIDFTTLTLNKPVEPFIDILIIAEAKTVFSEEEMKNLNDFIDRGGNLIIAADRKRQEAMNPLVERFGVTFEKGQVVEYNKGYNMDLITATLTEDGKKLAYDFENSIANRRRCVTMPGALALTYKEKEGFKYIPVLVADSIKNLPKASDKENLKKNYKQKDLSGLSEEERRMLTMLKGREDTPQDQNQYKGSWNELETTDFVDDVPMYNPKQGELGGPVTTALALTRKVGEKEQRIMILGDADCISNGEVTKQRTSIDAANFNFVAGMFFWLTDEEAPIDMRRPHNPDDKILLKKDGLGFYKILYRFIIPALFAGALLLIWLRRRGR